MNTTKLAPLIHALDQPSGVVLYPTETVYGLGSRAGDDEASRRIARIKERPVGPLIVLLQEIPQTAGPLARRLAARFWPGPLTLLVPKWDGLADSVCALDGTVGVRWSPHPIANALIAAVGPITSTSANLSGQSPPQDFDDVGPILKRVDAAYDAGMLDPSAASTIVHGATGQIIREGAIPSAAIEAVLRETL